ALAINKRSKGAEAGLFSVSKPSRCCLACVKGATITGRGGKACRTACSIWVCTCFICDRNDCACCCKTKVQLKMAAKVHHRLCRSTLLPPFDAISGISKEQAGTVKFWPWPCLSCSWPSDQA